MSADAPFSPPGPDALEAAAAAEVWGALASAPEGLSPAEAEARRGRFGENAVGRVKGPALLPRVAANFTHPMAVLLWAGAGAAFVARLPQLGVAVCLVNVINGAFSFWQEFRAERASEALSRLLPRRATVRRGGAEVSVPAEELVPGDVLVLAEGDRVSADARVVSASGLRVDQSTLTGEARPARKTDEARPDGSASPGEAANLVFAGTSVTSGRGTAVVFATGPATEFGRIARLTQALGEEPSPLQRELAHVTRVVTAIAVAVGLLFYVLAVLAAGLHPGEGFVFALGMIVAFVPEGLLPTVTLALAMGVQRMARRKALVKKLSTVETLGCTTVICTDKTGTLTQNEMTVTALWLPAGELEVTGAGYGPGGEVRPAPGAAVPAGSDLERLVLAAGLCSNARLAPPEAGSPRWRVLGDPTEGALLSAAAKAGVDLGREAAALPRVWEIPFEPGRKRMATVHRAAEGFSAFVKGSPREVLGRCIRVREEGRERPLTEERRRRAEEAVDRFARRGLRVLAVAEGRPGTTGEEPLRWKPGEVERDLTLLGLAGLADPPRPEVAEAVARCRRAGIRVILITGDYGVTAEALAREIGIVRSPDVRVVSGAEIDRLSGPELAAIVAGEAIFARASPEQKLRVVAALQAGGEVVAVTGDGVNDAPALRKADIGVAMGLSGTDVAREAADLVLADDNFASIVNAVEEGRAVYANIRKFLSYILTSNTPEAVPFILFALSRGRIPLALTVMQILSVDLGTDLVPALALGAEPPEAGVMDQPPRDLREHAVSPALLARAYLWLGPVQAAAAMGAFYFCYGAAGWGGRWLDLPGEGPLYRQATTFALAAVVGTQVGNLFAHRSEHASIFRVGLGGNRLLWVGVAAEAAALALLSYAPPLRWAFGTEPLPPAAWLLTLALVPCLPAVDEVRKALARRRGRRGARAGGPPGRGRGEGG